MEPEVQGVVKSKNIVPIVVSSVLLAALAAGGGVYAYQKSQNDKAQADLQNQITVLQQQMTASKTAVAIPMATTQPTAAASAQPTAKPTGAATPQVSWKKYSNERVGYQFEYPSSNLELSLDETIKYPSSVAGNSKNEDLVQFATGGTTYSVRTTVGVSQSNIKDWITYNSAGASQDLSQYTLVSVSGGQVEAENLKGKAVTYVMNQLFGKNIVYQISANTGTAPTNSTDAIYQHLISTFFFNK